MKDPVRLIVFTQEMGCQFCKEARELVQEVANLAPDKIITEIYDLVKDVERQKTCNGYACSSIKRTN